MKPKIFAIIGLVLIVIGIVLYIVGGQVQVNASEERERYKEDGDSYEVGREIIDDNLYADWLMGFSQILVFAGIGFILVGIAMRPQQPPEKELPPPPEEEVGWIKGQ